MKVTFRDVADYYVCGVCCLASTVSNPLLAAVDYIVDPYTPDRIPTIKSHRGHFVTKTTAIYSFGHALHTVQRCLGRLSLLSSVER